MRPEQARVEMDGLLEEFLERHSLRVRASHNRARADAGPSLKGGMHSFDRYIFDMCVRRPMFACAMPRTPRSRR